MAKQSKKFTPSWIPERKQHTRLIDNSAFYNGSKWRKFSRIYRQNNPLCIECDAEGIVTPAAVVDHIKPITEGGARLSVLNVQSLCNHHHNSKSGKEGAGKRV